MHGPIGTKDTLVFVKQADGIGDRIKGRLPFTGDDFMNIPVERKRFFRFYFDRFAF